MSIHSPFVNKDRQKFRFLDVYNMRPVQFIKRTIQVIFIILLLSMNFSWMVHAAPLANGSRHISEDNIPHLSSISPDLADLSLAVAKPNEDLDDLVVANGETVTVDDVRYPLPPLLFPAGSDFILLDETTGFLPGQEILILTMLGEGIGTFEEAIIESVGSGILYLSSPLLNSYDGSVNKVMVQQIPNYSNVLVQSGGTLTAHAWDGDTGGVVFFKAQNVTIESGGTITAQGLGFNSPNYGPGDGRGASHGGYGGLNDTGLPYGSTTEPMTMGSAATGYSDGGGVIRIAVQGTLTVDGILSADSPYPTYISHGSAGGSICLSAETITGTGIIQANGSDARTSFSGDHGSGAGGRIAVYFFENTFNGILSAAAGKSGHIGGPGTIYLENTNTGYQKLLVDNLDRSGRQAALADPVITNWKFDEIALVRKGHLELLDPTDTILLTTDNMAGDGTGQYYLKSNYTYTYPDLNGIGFHVGERVTLNLPADLTIRGAHLFNDGILEGITNLTLIPDGTSNSQVRLGALGNTSGESLGTYTFNTITIDPDQVLELAGDSIAGQGVTINATNMTVAGYLSADGLGYTIDHNGPGAPSNDYSGAGHGGRGGGSGGGQVYGDYAEPITLGSAGIEYCSGDGGGAIRLIIEETLEIPNGGVVSANGIQAQSYCGASAGGSIWIEAQSVTGEGFIEATGGDPSEPWSFGGGGGGGRIAVYTDLLASSIMFSADGGQGDNPGEAGTTYLGWIDPVLSSVIIDPDRIVVGGSSTGNIIVTLRSPDGDPLPDQPVEVGPLTGGRVSINGEEVDDGDYVDIGISNAEGVATATISAENIGIRIIQARSGSIILAQHPVVEFIPRPIDPTSSFIVGPSRSVPADGSTQVPIKVYVRDDLDNPVTNVIVLLSASGNAVVSQPEVPTDAQGIATGYITNDVAEVVSVTATANGIPIEDFARVTFRDTADLFVTLSAPEEVNPDQDMTYRVSVDNDDVMTALDTILTLELPPEVEYLSSSGWIEPTFEGNVLTWDIGNVSGPWYSFLVNVHIPETTPHGTNLTSTATATSSTPDSDPANNSTMVSTIVVLPYPAMAVSPSSPTMTVLKGDASDLAATVRNTGGALMTGVTISPPPTIPWVSVDPSAVGDIDPLNEATFTIHAAPPLDLTSGYYRDFVTVTDDFGNTGRIALSVRISAARRELQVTVENDQGALIQGATLSLVRQEESVVVTEGTVETYHESTQIVTPTSGLVTFAGLEIGAYDYTVSAVNHETTSGVLMVVEGTGVQEVTLTLNALGQIGMSPSELVLGIVRGQTSSTTITLTNHGAAPLTGLSIAPPAGIPFVSLGLPDPLPILQPGQSMQFSILASPPEDQIGDIFQGFVTATADGGLGGQLALTVQLTSDEIRDAEVNVVDIQNQPVAGGGSVTLVQQKLTTLIEEGETRTFNKRFTGELNSSGRVSFEGLEPGAYNFIASANGYTRETGEIIVQPGTGTQVETVTARIDPFSYSWTVVPIEQGYDITLTMTFDINTPDPVLTLPEVCWALEGGPTTEVIKVFNPSDIALNIESLSASLPGASIQIGSLPSVIGPQQLINIPVTATKIGSLGTGSVEVTYAWDATPDTFVTFTFNPSSHTSPLIYPSVTYTKDFEITPVVFDPATTYTLEIGQPSDLGWISLVADPSTPMKWTSSTVIDVSLTAVTPDFLAEGVYTDSAPITVTGNDGSFREGSLDITVTQTADGMYLHTNFTLGDIPTVRREATASGAIHSGECTPWEWSSVGGDQPKLIGHSSGSNASFPDMSGGPIYDFGHQQVRLELSQKVMLEGEAFQADLNITNTSVGPIEDISVDIRLTDLDGVDKSWGFDLIPNTPTDLGTIAFGSSSSQTWFIQPTDLGITSPDGEVYLASATITYISGGTTYTVTTVPERITVYPAPDLVITYQLPVPTIPCMVFPLKVTIHNRGEGPARNLRFSTAQPQLLDPNTGLPITFAITDTTLNGVKMENALNLPLGDLPAGESAVIVWTLESSIPGRFVEFTSDYRQSNYLGAPLSPLISEIHTILVPGECAGVPDWAIVSGASECLGAAYQGTYAVVGDMDNHTAGDPINTRTGGLSYQVTDMTFPTLAGALNFERWYASPTTDAYTDDLGYGWTHSLDSRLYFPDDPQGQEGAILLKLHSANRYEFDIQSDGTYTAYPGVCGVLTREDGLPTTYTFVDTAQQVYIFNESGRLQTIADPTGHLLHYVYDGDGRLSQVHDDGDRFISFSYDAQGRIEEVTDHSSRQVSYSYDPTTGDLTTTTDVLGGTWTYEYDDAHHLTRIIDPSSSIVERTEFDEQGRVFRQFDGHDQLVVRLDYNADGSTTVTDVHGNQQTYRYDERGELTDQTDPLGSVMGRTYDGNFRPSSFTDPAGNTTQLTWSSNGANLVQVTDASGGITHLSYDNINNLTEVIDPTGDISTFSYDGTLLTSLTDALGNTTTYTYTDADAPAPPGLLETITDPLGNTTSLTYDSLGQRTSMTDTLGNTTTYTYDDLGRLVEITDPLGRVTHHEYDTAGRLTRLVRNYDPLRAQNEDGQWNITTEFVYDAVGNMIETIDTLGRSTRYAYDNTNHLIAVTDPAGNQTEFELDERGNLIRSTDPLGRFTRYEVDALNRVVKVIDPLGGETHTAYDDRGNVSNSTDANGNTTSFEYDELNRPIVVIDALGGRTTTEYDALGNVLARTDPTGRRTTYAYDALSRLIRQTDPEGGVTQIFYDAAGNRVRTIDPNGGETHYEYDSLNRLIRVVDALGGVTEYAYDPVGNQIAFTDANGNTTTYNFDLLNRIVEVQDPLGNVSHTEYDALGNVLATLDALGNRTSYIYDILNRLIEQTDPVGSRMSYSYDAVGNQLSFTDANSHTMTTVYNELNRPVETHDPEGQVNRTTYDPVGNVLTLADGLNQTTTFAYDALYRQVSTTDPLGNITQYEYNQVGNRIAMIDAEGVVTRYEYDGMNQLTAVVENYRPGFAPDSQTNVRTEYSYDANGNRLTILDANGNTTAFDYDLLSRMVEVQDALGNATSYGYDPVGNRINLTDAMGFTTSFAYDELNRRVGIDYPESDPDVQFIYDAVGNRKQMIDGVGTTTWTYDTLHRPMAVTDPFGDRVSYAYDAVGNRTQLIYPDGKTVSYSYDASDRMIQVTDWDSLVTSYSYDLANRLIETSLPNGVVSSYDYDAAGRLLEIEHRTESDLLSSFSYSYDTVGNRTQVVEVMSWPDVPQPVTVDVQSIPMAQAPVAQSGSTIPVDPLTAGLAPFGLLLLIPLMRRRQPGHPHLLSALVIIAGISLALAACNFPIPTLPPRPTRTPWATSTPTITPTLTPSPIPSDTPTPTPVPVVVTTTTIDYNYDPLYRLIAADYDSGEFFHFTYDAIGNRLTQDTHLASNVYSYDDANRLTSVDGVPYTWDANGNLLDDGLRTYAYDHADRLSSIVLGADTYAFNYNGLGDRLQQLVNGVASDYTLDIETGLTQVLSDGDEVFLYGVDRIAQQGIGGHEYYLGDALRSTRQLVSSTGQTRLGRAYEPFGDLLSIAGELQTSYGFAGEWSDDTGLIHLRARYYQPADGRFVQPDPFAGIPTQPISQNPYPYAYDNPLMYTDASGRNPILAAIISGAALGGIIGAVGGGFFARLIYDWSIQGKCGCEMQMWALSVNGPKWILKTTLLSGAIGFIAGGLAAAAPIGEIVVGLAGVGAASYDLIQLVSEIYTRWQATSEYGFTRCELLRFAVDVVGWLGSALLLARGVTDLQQPSLQQDEFLTTWEEYNPTGRTTSSETPTSPSHAEKVLRKDLGVDKYRGRFLASEYGLEAKEFRQPDFVDPGFTWMADSKWYGESTLSLTSQLRDYVTIALAENMKLYIYVRKSTYVTRPALEAIRSTGGKVIWYFP